ncbi:MAG: MFS transporter [Solirubrobacteraceae bacterium]
MPILHRNQAGLIPFIALFASQTGLLVLTPVLPDVARDLGVSTATPGGLRVASGLAGGAVALSLAAVGRRVGLRDLIACGLLLIALGSAVGAAAPTFAVLAVAQLAVGAGNATVLSAAVAAASRWSAPGERGRALSWALLGQPAAWIAGMPLVGALASGGWRLALLFPVAASACALLALTARRRDDPDAGSDAIRVLVRHHRGVAGWATGELLAYAAWGATLTFAGALLVESYGLSAGVAGGLLGAAAAAYFPGNLLTRRHLRDGSARRLLVGLGAALAVSLFVFGAVRPGPGFSTAVFALAVMLAGGRTLAGSTAGFEAAPGHEVAVMSIRAGATQLGLVAGAATGGLALAAGGYALLGGALSFLFAAATIPHLAAARLRSIPNPNGLRPATQGGRP